MLPCGTELPLSSNFSPGLPVNYGFAVTQRGFHEDLPFPLRLEQESYLKICGFPSNQELSL